MTWALGTPQELPPGPEGYSLKKSYNSNCWWSLNLQKERITCILSKTELTTKRFYSRSSEGMAPSSHCSRDMSKERRHSSQIQEGTSKLRPRCRHVEETRHTTPDSQARGGCRGLKGLPLPLLPLLSEYMLLGVFLAPSQHPSQRLRGWGE